MVVNAAMAARVSANDTIDFAGTEAVVGQEQLHGARFEIRQSVAGEPGVGGAQLLVIAIGCEAGSVVTAGETRPVATLEGGMHSVRPHEGCHREDLLVLAAHHLPDHVFGIAEPSRTSIEAHDLAKPPGSALERRTPIAGDCLLEPLILVGAIPTVASGRAADPRVGGVETLSRVGTEDMTFEQDAGPPVRQETAAGGLDSDHRPQYRRIEAGMRRRRGQAVAVQRVCCPDKGHGTNPRPGVQPGPATGSTRNSSRCVLHMATAPLRLLGFEPRESIVAAGARIRLDVDVKRQLV